ncbi:GerAB/ArcD/ProY family transporter [Cohnella kolymensis]|uniref:GerAB/ArcD/ProY family transporter n=1 Tax=Cohnella kolymensis TaxID=1590652 RepID=UPI00069600C0|nr:GerAB/ArcD/ProY family transporter [Cohnella kolymensis]
MFGICLARGVRSGITTLFRSAQGVFFFSIISVALFPLFATKEFRMDMAIGLLTNVNLRGTWNGAMMVAAIFGEIAFVAYFFAYFAHQPKLKKSLFWAVCTAAAVILSDVIATTLLFGPELGANFTYPILELIRYVHTGAFLENLDPLLLVFWLYSMFLKISFLLLTSVTGLTYTLGLNDHKPFAYTLTAFAVGLSLFMFESTANVEEITRHGESAFLLLIDLVPAIYLLVDWLRSMGRKKDQSQSAQAVSSK